MNLQDLLNPGNNDVWSKYVPLVNEKNHTKVFLTDTIEEPANYNELCYALKTASSAEVFTLYINTPGGVIDSANMIIDAIQTSKAKVIAEISGTVASAGTIITLACDEVKIADHTAFMIHNYSGGVMGKGHEMKAHQEFVDKNLNDSFKIFYKDFLSEDEIEDVIDGRDMWMNKLEVLARLNGTFHTKGIEDVAKPKAKRGRPKKTS
jgi:ATP-dependent protease ClpP protease subunit